MRRVIQPLNIGLLECLLKKVGWEDRTIIDDYINGHRLTGVLDSFGVYRLNRETEGKTPADRAAFLKNAPSANQLLLRRLRVDPHWETLLKKLQEEEGMGRVELVTDQEEIHALAKRSGVCLSKY